MKATVILIPTVAEQREAGETAVVMPEGVRLVEGQELHVYPDGDYGRMPVGTASNIRVENGRLVADIDFPMLQFGYAGLVHADETELLNLSAGWSGPANPRA